MGMFRILNFGHFNLPFDQAQSGESFDFAQDREPFDFAQDREPVEWLAEPFEICYLEFGVLSTGM